MQAHFLILGQLAVHFVWKSISVPLSCVQGIIYTIQGMKIKVPGHQAQGPQGSHCCLILAGWL